MKITLGNFEHDIKKIDPILKKIQKLEEPEFARYSPDIKFFKKDLKKFEKYKNVIVIGHGGSITSTQGFYGALRKVNKKLYVVDSPEPDFLSRIKNECDKRDSVVVVVSKSGTNVDILEIAMDFIDYKMLVITNPESGTLLEIAQHLSLDMIEHPNIGGRFSGFTSSALVPCFLLGFDIDKLFAGAKEMYRRCGYEVGIKKNPALEIAVNLYLADMHGRNEIFAPVYSKKMLDFSNLLIQLFHESVCKHGMGQTIYAASAPESQHHTNQRFFGGKKNVCAIFLTSTAKVQRKDRKIKVPKELRAIPLRDGTLKDIEGNKYSDVLMFEYYGVLEHAKKAKIPFVNISMEKVDERELGGFVALWHYVAVYSALLRGVNPFDQPEVEYAKNISFEMRKTHKKK